MTTAWKTITLGLGLVCASALIAPAAKADEWNKKTEVTFSSPVEVPGRVLLPGSYVFKLADTISNRQIVEIYDSNDHLVTTLFAVGDYRLNDGSKNMLTFAEGKRDSPESIREWFYPGEHSGLEFVYPARKRS